MIPKNPELLKTLMQAQGISARELAREAGYASSTSINRLLAGEARTIDPIVAANIADVLQVQVGLLFGERVSRGTRRNAAGDAA